jgi:quercetin dioxygenase-like cupin family protein
LFAEKGRKTMTKKVLLAVVLAALLGVVAIQAQAPAPSGIKRNILLKEDLAPMPAMTSYVVETELAPGAESGWHTHAGHDFDYVRSGEAVLQIEGKPDQTLKPGMGIHIQPGVPHNVHNDSKSEPFRISTVYLIEQGKPVGTPVPAPTKK